MLPVIKVYINGKKCTAVVDLGCSCSYMNKWRMPHLKQSGGECVDAWQTDPKSWGNGTIELKTDNMSPVKVTVLVVGIK